VAHVRSRDTGTDASRVVQSADRQQIEQAGTEAEGMDMLGKATSCKLMRYWVHPGIQPRWTGFPYAGNLPIVAQAQELPPEPTIVTLFSSMRDHKCS